MFKKTLILWILGLLLPASAARPRNQSGRLRRFRRLSSAGLGAQRSWACSPNTALTAIWCFSPVRCGKFRRLLGDSIQFAQADAATALNAINQGADLVIMSGSLNSFPVQLCDLQRDAQTRRFNRQKNRHPRRRRRHRNGDAARARRRGTCRAKSVTIFPAGDSAARIVALSAKAIDGTMLSYPDINEALRLGMHEFAKMSDVKGSSFPMNVMVARRCWVEKNRDTVKRFQQAYAEGVYQFMNSKEKGIAVLAKWLRYQKPQGRRRDLSILRQELLLSHPSFPRRLAQHLGNHRPAQSRGQSRYESGQAISTKARSTNWNAKAFSNDSAENRDRRSAPRPPSRRKRLHRRTRRSEEPPTNSFIPCRGDRRSPNSLAARLATSSP